MQFLKDWISREKFLTTITRRKGIQIQKIHRVFIEGPGNSQRVVIDEDCGRGGANLETDTGIFIGKKASKSMMTPRSRA